MNRKNQSERRTDQREAIWPGSSNLIWSRKTHDGYATVSRLLPWVSALIKQLSKTGDPSSVYIELWCRCFDEGLVQIIDEADSAFACGYTGTRAVRTWQERMFQLKELGFIDSKRFGNREYGSVLLHDPVRVCVQHWSNDRVNDEWWTSFVARADAVGAKLDTYIKEVGPKNAPPNVKTLKKARTKSKSA